MIRLWVFPLLFFLTACGAVTEPFGLRDPFGVPQPFRGQEQNKPMLAKVMEVPGILVTPVDGLTAEEQAALAPRLVEAIQGQEIVAVLENPPFGAWTLRAQVLAADPAAASPAAKPDLTARGRGKGTAAARARLKPGSAAGSPGKPGGNRIAFKVLNVSGAETGGFSVAWPGAMGDEAAIRRFAQETAARLDATLAQKNPEAAVIAPAALPKVEALKAFVEKVNGAPGDGNQVLARSMAVMLAELGFTLVDQSDKDAYAITAQVKVEPGPIEKDLVSLTWRVRNPNGAEIGTLDQKNAVKAGLLAKQWGETAALAAAAAAPGIAELIARQGKPKSP